VRWRGSLIILLLMLPVAACCVQAGAGDYIVIRANVNMLYIEGESIPIQARVLVYENGKPTDQSATLKVSIRGMDNNVTRSNSLHISGGRRLSNFFLSSIDMEGHFRLTVYAERGGVKSQVMAFEFGVSKAPVPYTCYFNRDGSRIHFKSLRTNESGVPDPDFPFDVKVYFSRYGEDRTMIKSRRGVTEATIRVPEDVQRSLGVCFVDVVDMHGWLNSDGMNIDQGDFSGEPPTYAFGHEHMEPYRSSQLQYVAIGVISILVILAVVAYLGLRRRS